MEQSSLGWWRRRRSCFSPPWSSASSTLLSALSIVSSTLSACLGLRKCLHIYCFLYEKQVKCCFRAIWIGMIAGITAYYAIGLKNVYDDMSDAPAAGLSLFMFMIVYLFEDMSFAEGLLLSLFSCPGQLNRWHCPSVTQSARLLISASSEQCRAVADLSDNWSDTSRLS